MSLDYRDPRPGIPKADFLAEDLARWTFASRDQRVQTTEFNYWTGWFGFEEEDAPYSIEGRVWFVRRQRR